MKIYKWVPVTSHHEPKKSLKLRENKENLARALLLENSNSNSNLSMSEDSNTCESMEMGSVP